MTIPMKMQVAAISDTHGRSGWMMPDCDVFIHAGDITAGGTLPETATFATELRRRMDMGGVGHLLIVPGNHDRCFQKQEAAVRALFASDPRVHILIDQGVTIDSKTFWGSPWTPPFMKWYFMAEEDRLAEIYRGMPAEVDMLITHGPARGILDPGHDGSNVGSTALLQAIQERRIHSHVFGHLHAAGGRTIYGPANTWHHNVAAVDDAYQLRRDPAILDI